VAKTTKNEVLEPFHETRHDHAHCIGEALAAADQLCLDAGVRLTPLRRRVLELVWQSHEPVGAYDLLDRLRHERRRAAPPTVYRALDFLLEQGLIHRIESLNAYVGCGEPHDRHGGQFLICRDCGSVAELNDGDIADTVVSKARRQGFHVQRQTIEILGLCPNCGKKAGAIHAG
jgi:Fur family zinc uptake transcriptional regulator